MIDKPIELIEADLAAGDGQSLQWDSRAFELSRIASPDDPRFNETYQKLWEEFGAAHEMETREVIRRRLSWHPTFTLGNRWLRYEIILVQRQGAFVAARDHTAIVTMRAGRAHAVVHLSHVLIDPAWRRTGLAGWLRAWPIQTARACLAAAVFPPTSPITLVAEMEHPGPNFPNRLRRLQSYEKAGFKKVDPTAVNYFQPDFRSPPEIDASGGPQPLPFGLVVRRVGRERETRLPGAEVRDIVQSLYSMYGTGFRERDMAVVRQSLDSYPAEDMEIALVSPTR